MGILEFFLHKYIFTVLKEKPKGYIYTNSVSLRHGVIVWGKRNEYTVVRYPILLIIGGTVFNWVLVDNLIDFGNTNWFGKILDYNYCWASVVFAYTLMVKQKELADLGEALDQWWSYDFLEGDQEMMKENLQKKLNKFHRYFYPLIMGAGIGFCVMPFGRYLSESQKSSMSILLFQCWSPFPLTTWWGFLITYLMEVLTMLPLFYYWTFILTFLITVMETIGNQLALIGISLLTAEKRALRMMGWSKKDHDYRRNVNYVRILQKQLRNSAIHYQKLYGLAKDACKLFGVPINICLYSGMFALVLSCVKLATERNNKFVIFQAFLMFITVLVSQLAVSCINQILLDQMESLRETVYDSSWHHMPIPCRKVMFMFQVMVMKPPSITTIMGINTDMKFFATVVQTSYFYLGALLSMNVKF